jgi:hypothetical protein
MFMIIPLIQQLLKLETSEIGRTLRPNPVTALAEQVLPVDVHFNLEDARYLSTLVAKVPCTCPYFPH